MISQLPSAQELALARAKLYQLLAEVYAQPPTHGFSKSLAEWATSLTEAEGPFQLLSEQMQHGLTMLARFFKERGGNSEKELGEAVSVEFTRLFRGVKPSYSPLPPYESVYREEAQRTFGELTSAVHQEYRRFGLELTKELSGEPPDHISFELGFMHHLCEQEGKEWERDNEEEARRLWYAERDFLKEHLKVWLPGFCDEMRKHDRLGLFSALADLTEGWVNFDYQQHLAVT